MVGGIVCPIDYKQTIIFYSQTNLIIRLMIKLKNKTIYSLFAASAIFAACTSDNDGVTTPVVSGEAATMEISIATVPGLSRASSGTEDGSALESLVSSFEVYLFNAADGSVQDYKLVADGTKKAILSGVSGGSYTVSVVTNSVTPIGSVSQSVLYSKLGQHEFLANSAYNATSLPATGPEMSGEATVLNAVEGTNPVTVNVKRLVSKFNAPTFVATALSSQASNEELAAILGDGATVSNTSFTFNGYALVNGLNKSDLFSQSTWSNSGKSYLNSTFTNGLYTHNYSGNANGSWFIHDNTPVYVYENRPTEVLGTTGTAIGYEPESVYAFIIEGTIYSSATTQSATRYWRVNLVKSTGTNTGNTTIDDYKVYRNGLYKVTINNINTVGYETPEEAEKQEELVPVDGAVNVEVTVEVSPWDVYESNTDM